MGDKNKNQCLAFATQLYRYFRMLIISTLKEEGVYYDRAC